MNASFFPIRRTAAACGICATLLAVSALAGCSSDGYVGSSDYVSPIAATPAPMPSVPMASGGSSRAGRMPLLPPVPENESSKGLPPVAMAGMPPAL